MPIELDEFDIKILNIIQRNNRLPLETIAQEVCLSSSAIQRRLGRLRRTGVIQSDVAVLSPQAIGRKLMAIVEVTVEHEHPDGLKAFNELMLNTPEIMQCYYVTGDADFVVIITAEDMKEFDELTARFFSENAFVKKFRTRVVVKTIKTDMAVPLKLEHCLTVRAKE